MKPMVSLDIVRRARGIALAQSCGAPTLHFPAVQAFQFGAAQGYQALADAVRELGPESPFTRLVPDLSGARPGLRARA